jgi:hypothetical protein
MQLILTDIFEAQLVRGLPEMQAEVLDGTDVGLWVFGDMLRIVMSSIMRWRSGVVCLVMGYSCRMDCTERAIFLDRMLSCDGHFPIASHRHGSENRYFPTFRKWLC